MKTLFIEYTYLKGNRGGIYAARTHINLFATLSTEMTLVYPMASGMEPEGIMCNKVKMIPVYDDRSRVRKYTDLLRGYVHRYNLDESFFDPKRFDIVVFDNSVVSSRLIKKFKAVGIKTITIHHNYQIEYLKGDGSRLTLLPDLLWTKKYEGEAVRNSDLNLTLTTQDVSLLKKHYSKVAHFAVLGVYEYQQNDIVLMTNTPRKHRFIITGGLGSKQNESSLIPWLKNYYPKVCDLFNDVSLTLAGRSPSKRLTSIAESLNVNVIASPPVMSPLLENSDIYICPTDRGGGLKLRIMDGLRFGLPVVTHEISARGYENMIDAGIVYTYSDTKSFIESIKKAAQVCKSRSTIQKIFTSNFSFERGIMKLREILTQHDILLL